MPLYSSRWTERIRPKCSNSNRDYSLAMYPCQEILAISLLRVCGIPLSCWKVQLFPNLSFPYRRATNSTSLMMIESAFFKQNKGHNAFSPYHHFFCKLSWLFFSTSPICFLPINGLFSLL